MTSSIPLSPRVSREHTMSSSADLDVSPTRPPRRPSASAGDRQPRARAVSSANPDDAAEQQQRMTCGQKARNWFHYETLKIVRIQNVKVSFVHIGLALIILAYILIYGLWYKRGYQKTSQAIGSSNTKVQGTGYTNSILPWFGPDSEPQFVLYDAFDLRSPPLEVDSVFLTTNMWMTLNQTRGVCVSYDTKSPNTCDEDHPCTPLFMTNNGRQTGHPGSCKVNYTDPQQLWPVPKGGFCEVYGWCPAEYEVKNSPFSLLGVEQSTLFARIRVHYPELHTALDNSAGQDILTAGLNSWTFEEMVNQAGYQWHEVNSTGILLAMETVWDCDFDHGGADCSPKIRFYRLDDPKSPLSSGYNFRTVQFLHDAKGARELTKRYGVRLLILMSGIGSLADPVATLTAIGAGIGLLSVATLIADFIATKILAARDRYSSAKYKEVTILDPKSKIRLFDALEAELVQEDSTDQAGGGAARARDPASVNLAGNTHSLAAPLMPGGSNEASER